MINPNNVGNSTDRLNSKLTERLDRDPFLEIGLKVPDSFEKLITTYEKKIQSMVEKGWDTGNDPDKLAMFQRWHNFKTKFQEESSYQSYLRDKKIPLIQEFILSIDLGGWIKKDRLFAKISSLASVLNMEVPLIERLLNEEIKRQNIDLRTIAPPPLPVKDLKANITGKPGFRKVELTWITSSDCSHYILCRGPLENPPANSRQGRIKMLPNSIGCYTHESSDQDVGISFSYVVFSFRQEDNQSSATSVEVHFPGELNPESLRVFQQYQDIVIEWQPIISCKYYILKIAGIEYKTTNSNFRYRVDQSKSVDVEIYTVLLNDTISSPLKKTCYFELPPLETPKIDIDRTFNSIILNWQTWKNNGWKYRILRSRFIDFKEAEVIGEVDTGSFQDPTDVKESNLSGQQGIEYYYSVYPWHEILSPFSITQIPEKLTVHHAGPALLPKEVEECHAQQNGCKIEITWKNSNSKIRCHIFKRQHSGLPKIKISESQKKLQYNFVTFNNIEIGENTIYCGCVIGKQIYYDENPHPGNNCYLIIADYDNYGLATGMIVTTSFYPPPEIPIDFVGESQFKKIKLRWRKPEGRITGYSLYRGESNNLSKAILIADLPEENCASYKDYVTEDTPYMYFLFSHNQQITSVVAAQAGPYQGYLDIKNLEIILRGKILELLWSAPSSCSRVLVYRKTESKGEELISQGNRLGYTDSTGIVGKKYQYRVCCEYLQLDGSSYLTPGLTVEATLIEFFPTFSKFICHHFGSMVLLQWNYNSSVGTVVILGSKELFEISSEMTLDEFTLWKEKHIVENIPVLSNQTAKHFTSEPTIYYYPLIIFQNRVYSTPAIVGQYISEIEANLRGYCQFPKEYFFSEDSDLSVEKTKNLFPIFKLEWDWPKDVKKVRICRKQEQFSSHALDSNAQFFDISKISYFQQGYFSDPDLVEPNGNMYYYTIYRVELGINGEIYSPGVQENCRLAVSYSFACIKISLEFCEKKIFFKWNSEYLASVKKYIQGDFVLVYTLTPATINSWKRVHLESSQHNILEGNIFEQPQGKVALPSLPKQSFVKILWKNLQDNRYIELHPWCVRI